MFKLSPEATLDGAVTVETKFIVEYMPYADGDYVKVYLYGLSLAARKSDPDDTAERLARRLGMDISAVNAAIEYWTDQGLMSRLGDDITYLPPRTARAKIKKYDVDKYAEFNRQAQLYIAARQIVPNEYNDYYALMEKFGVEWQAMVLIVKYCVDLKGDNVSCPYILAVARNLAQDGYRTHDEVEARLEEFGVYYNDLCEITNALGGKRPDHEAVRLYKKWTKVYKFDKSVILHVASAVKRGGLAALDAKLTSYGDLGMFTAERIDAYEAERKAFYSLAKSVNKALGLYYDNLEPEIAAYIRPWLDMGFEQSAIIALADYCMRINLKTLSDLDAVVRDFFSSGVTTEKAVSERIDRENRYDPQIRDIMKTVGLQGAIKGAHRAYYAAWADKLNMPTELINYCASLACGKDSPFAYMNAILTAWHDAGVKTLDGAKAHGEARAEAAASVAPNNGNTVVERYTAEQLDALVTHFTDED